MQIFYRFCVIALLAGLCTACGSSGGTKPVVAEPEPVSPVILDLLDKGQKAVQAFRLTKPKDNNARDYFQQVLDLDPDNQAALEGMKSIGARYLVLAQSATTKAEISKAEGYLKLADQFQGDPQVAARIRSEIEAVLAHELASHPDNEYPLNRRDLKSRNEGMVDKLHEIAREAAELKSRLLIIARTDAEGRWIYQMMREAIKSYRLRGNIEVGAKPKVVLIDKQVSEE